MVLYSRQRSGSSFVGGLFSHNPAVYYTFEPMNFVCSSKVQGDINNPTVVSSRLEEISRCNFRETLTRTRKKDYWRTVSFCAKFTSNSILHRMCTMTSISGWENTCKMFNFSLSKDIVIPSLDVMLPLIDKGSKVLHLVRDPRAVVNSRIKMENPQNISSSKKVDRYHREIHKIAKHCKETQHDLDTVLDKKVNRLHPLMAYHLLRYEDIALSPKKYARDIYRFSGFPYHISIDLWINESTNLADDNPDIRRTFGLKRNSRKPVSAWTRTLPLEFIHLIESVCVDMMTSLGYTRIPRDHMASSIQHLRLDQLLGEVHKDYVMLNQLETGYHAGTRPDIKMNFTIT